jgi:hypothetical protein
MKTVYTKDNPPVVLQLTSLFEGTDKSIWFFNDLPNVMKEFVLPTIKGLEDDQAKGKKSSLTLRLDTWLATDEEIEQFEKDTGTPVTLIEERKLMPEWNDD